MSVLSAAEVLNLRQALKRGETLIDVKHGANNGFDSLALKIDGDTVDVFVDEVKNVSGRVRSATALGVGGARGITNLADNLQAARKGLESAFNDGTLTRAQYRAALTKLDGGKFTVRLVGSAGRTTFGQTLQNSIAKAFGNLLPQAPTVKVTPF